MPNQRSPLVSAPGPTSGTPHALPAGDLRDAAPKLLRYRLWQIPARLTRGQRKRWLHLRADWPRTTDVINTWQAIKAIPAPT